MGIDWAAHSVRRPEVDRPAKPNFSDQPVSDRANRAQYAAVQFPFHWPVANARRPTRDSPKPRRHWSDESAGSENIPSPKQSTRITEARRAQSRSREKAPGLRRTRMPAASPRSGLW